MNYRESKLILEEIGKANRILINCHYNPDPDSIGSALAMYEVLLKMGKKAEIICPSENLYPNVSFLKNYKVIRPNVNFKNFDFSIYDLFIIIDSSDWRMVSGNKESPPANIFLAVIDHHDSNQNFGNVNLVDKKINSVGEVLYLVFQDWNVILTKEIANDLLTAIIGDTGAFLYPGTTSKTLRIAADLIEKGADKDKIIFHIYRSYPFNLIKFFSEVLKRAQVDESGKFFWSAIPYKVYKRLGSPQGIEYSASLFAQSVEATSFGFVAVERRPKELSISLRSRTGFDTCRIAKALGGGGHKLSSGARIVGLSFEKALNEVLRIAREYGRGK